LAVHRLAPWTDQELSGQLAHLVAADIPLNVPAAHDWQVVLELAPEAAEKVPAEQELHVPMELAPVAPEKVPVPHAMHVEAPAVLT